MFNIQHFEYFAVRSVEEDSTNNSTFYRCRWDLQKHSEIWEPVWYVTQYNRLYRLATDARGLTFRDETYSGVGYASLQVDGDALLGKNDLICGIKWHNGTVWQESRLTSRFELTEPSYRGR